MRSHYDERVRRIEAAIDGDPWIEEDLAGYRHVRRELLAAERAALADLRRAGELPDHVARGIGRDLDLEEARLPD